ncbi:MAG TPA: CDP-diacylglycerol--serine O-phosphatidyltransferase, partial [Bacteroidia bacterium]|nr:CDP-diacylglycerol--serine O-phosphatidyltransferase [Bacteroidia bacterium]
MKIFSVPNLLSLGNLLCGCIAILNVIDGNIAIAVYLVMIACVFDFLDGFAARGLKQGSPMGKELDSLADMVTFGVVPGMVMFQMIRFAADVDYDWHLAINWKSYLPYVGFIIPLFSGLRLAKFNVDTRQSDSFIGLPTLANALLICGLPILFQLNQSNDYIYNGQTYLLQDYVPRVMDKVSDLQSSVAAF